MKISIIAAALYMSISPAFAQQAPSMDSPEASQAIQQWLKSRTAQIMAERQAKATKIDVQKDDLTVDQPVLPEPGVHIYSIKDYPAPDIVKQSILHGAELSRRGVLTIPPERVLTEAQAREKLASWGSQPLDVLKNSLTFNPAELSATPLSKGELLDAGTVGATVSNGRSTGLTRTYHVAGLGLVTFDEVDYPSSPNVSIALAKESFNSDISGVPAITRAARTTDGRGSAMLRWITPVRSYRLSLITDNGAHIEQDQQVLKTIAMQMVEYK